MEEDIRRSISEVKQAIQDATVHLMSGAHEDTEQLSKSVAYKLRSLKDIVDFFKDTKEDIDRLEAEENQQRALLKVLSCQADQPSQPGEVTLGDLEE
jgi:hypothetical protein